MARKWQAGPEPLVLTILSPRVAVQREVFMGCLYVYWSVPVFIGMFIFRGVYVCCVACPRLGERFVPFPDAFQPGLPPLAAGLQVLAVSCRRHGAENEPPRLPLGVDSMALATVLPCASFLCGGGS